MIDDVELICNSVSLRAEISAVRLYIKSKSCLPYYMYDLVKKYIIRYNKLLNSSDIDFAQNQEIIVNGTRINTRSFYEFETDIFNLKMTSFKI